MAILQALLALVTRSLGRMLSTVFGWAVVAMFGQGGRETTALSALVAAAVAWPLLLLGVAFPRFAAFALAFLPLPESIPTGVIRGVWVFLAVAVPLAVGAVMAARRRRTAAQRGISVGTASDGDRAPAPRESSRAADILNGVPVTVAVAAAFLVVFVTVPVLRIVSAARRRIEVQVPLVTDRDNYAAVGGKIARTLERHGFETRAADPPWWMTLPSRILLRVGGQAFRNFVPDRLLYLRGPSLEAALYPNGLLLRGPERETAWAQGVVVDALTSAPAFQTFDPAAQDIERQIRNVWQVYRENPAAHGDSVLLRARLLEIGRDIRRLPVDYDEWQIVYRQALQLGRALDGEGALLDEASGLTSEDAPTSSPAEEPNGARIQREARRQLVERLALLVAASVLTGGRPGPDRS